jgi:hypothetical protein
MKVQIFSRSDEYPLGETHPEGKTGFSLVELLTATFITSLMLVGSIGMVVQQQSMHRAQRQMTEIRQNIGFAMDLVLRDIRMAGYGLVVPETELASWIDWIPNFTGNPMIAEGVNGAPDTLSIFAAFDSPVAQLASSVSTGDTQFAVQMLDPTPNLLNTYNLRILFLNKTETIRITDIQGAGTNLTLSISVHPTNITGLQNPYPAGSTLELVKLVEYDWEPANGPSGLGYPYITRADDAAIHAGGGHWEVSSGYIEDFQISAVDSEFTVAVTGVASGPDLRYYNPVHQDHLRRRTVWGIARLRN